MGGAGHDPAEPARLRFGLERPRAAELPDPGLELRAVHAVRVDLRDHVLEGQVGRLRRPVGEEDARLPAVQAALVGEQEVEEAANGRLAVGEPDRVGQLRSLVDAAPPEARRRRGRSRRFRRRSAWPRRPSGSRPPDTRCGRPSCPAPAGACLRRRSSGRTAAGGSRPRRCRGGDAPRAAPSRSSRRRSGPRHRRCALGGANRGRPSPSP